MFGMFNFKQFLCLLIVEHKVNNLNRRTGNTLEKMRQWCAYQERSQYEARRKLQAAGIEPVEAEQMIANLVSENFINEQRFARAFAGGKFRLKQWGRNKIRLELKKHRISDPCIIEALGTLAIEDYEKAAGLVIAKKLKTVLSSDRRKKYYSALNYAVSKGFEPEIVITRLNELLGEQNYEFRT
jgi:regulatory protein